MRNCKDCGSIMDVHGCTNCNEESYIVDQYLELDMDLPNEETGFMKKYKEQKHN